MIFCILNTAAGPSGAFFFNFLFCVWTCKGGITKSNRMWCEMTASNVACHGSVRQTSLTSLQMENSLCCIVFHARGQVCSSLFLSVVVNTINPVTDWWDRDCLQGWFRRFILARWPSAFAAEVFLFNFDLLRVRLSFFSRSAEQGLHLHHEVDSHSWHRFIPGQQRNI